MRNETPYQQSHNRRLDFAIRGRQTGFRFLRSFSTAPLSDTREREFGSTIKENAPITINFLAHELAHWKIL